MTIQCFARVFDPKKKKKTMIVSVSETEKEVDEEFCEEIL